MSLLVPIALFGWMPVMLGLFALLPARRAVIAAFLIAWLFLPMAGYKLPGLPDYTKMTATCVGVLLGAAIFDAGRLFAFRPKWVDLPMAVWCLCPFASSLANGLGAYDGASAVLNQTIIWGLPYLIGRLYFTDLGDVRELAIGIFIGGLLYVPLCLYEIRMSPQLHTMIYGFHQHSFAQTYRWGGWRPTVFMQHGLMVGMWMSMASLVGIWLWTSDTLKRLLGIPMAYLVPVLLVTTVLCKSAGALALLIVGIGALFAARWTRSSIFLWCLIAAPPLYMGLRASGQWTGEGLVSLSARVMSEQRAGSLKFRMDNEDMLAAKALQRPILGWGGWGRARVFDERGNDISITDGLWIIALGNHGVVGLMALTVSLLLPAVLLACRWPTTVWGTPTGSGAVALAMVTVLYMIDNIPNGMVNPIFTLVAGGAITATSNRIGLQHIALSDRNCGIKSQSQRMRFSASDATQMFNRI
ncbi:MAG: O-antigen ligase domain-containing protein [Bacillota bacterium]